MDYVFFAFSSMCLGFTVLLFTLLLTRQDRPLLLRHLLLAGAVSLVYYYLEVSVFNKQISFYYLFNSIPQALMFIVLGIYLWKNNHQS